jgi:uncharacterized protein YqeY
MDLLPRLESDLKAALKAGDRMRTGVLRMLKARLQEAAVAQRGKAGRDAALSPEDAVAALAAYAKQRRESAAGYRQAGREDLALKEEQELAVVETYLPAQLDEAAVREQAAAAIAECGAASPRDMGKVMQLLMPRLRGAADGKVVSRVVQELLKGKP